MKLPLSVRIGLLGHKGRRQTIARIWIGYLLAITSLLTAERTDVLRIALAVVLAIATTWAVVATRWMDRHERWPAD